SPETGLAENLWDHTIQGFHEARQSIGAGANECHRAKTLQLAARSSVVSTSKAPSPSASIFTRAEEYAASYSSSQDWRTDSNSESPSLTRRLAATAWLRYRCASQRSSPSMALPMRSGPCWRTRRRRSCEYASSMADC